MFILSTDVSMSYITIVLLWSTISIVCIPIGTLQNILHHEVIVLGVYECDYISSAAMNIAPSVVKMLWQCCNTHTEVMKSHMKRDESAPLIASKSQSTNTDPLLLTPNNVASRDAPLRWLSLVAFLLVMIPTVAVLSVLMILRINYV